MNALNDLLQRLSGDWFNASQLQRVGLRGQDMANLVKELKARFNSGNQYKPNSDRVRQSLQVFAQQGRVQSLSHARNVCYALSRSFPGQEEGVLADTRLFHALLDNEQGIGRWRKRPLAFTRCYRGLVSSYFEFYGLTDDVRLQTSNNWCELRQYLYDSTDWIQHKQHNPRWVDTAMTYRGLFAEIPEKELTDAAVRGDEELLHKVYEDLFIGEDSWFRHRLLLSRVRAAVEQSDKTFVAAISGLLRLIGSSQLVRDEALALILERYMACDDASEHTELRDAAVDWWGNPWLPSQELHWGRVKKHVRNQVAQWLHKEFIEAFFGKLASENVGDSRRIQFWSRYLGQFSDMHFGLSDSILYSRNPDFMKLIKKMQGLYAKLRSSSSSDQNAFIMTLGNLVVVEFSNESNALYAYRKNSVPFDYEHDLQMRVDATNSLKHSAPNSLFKLMHKDGHVRWEEKFAERIAQHTGIRPRAYGRASKASKPKQYGNSKPRVKMERWVLDTLRSEYGIESRDLRSNGGNLWVLTDDSNSRVNEMLKSCNFAYRSGRGWWKKA